MGHHIPKGVLSYSLVLLAGLAVLVGCGQGSGGSPTSATNYSLALAPPVLTIAQGANAPTAVTITRTNFTDAVTLSLGKAPTGVTKVFSPAAPTGTNSTLTVSADPTVFPGVYNLTVDGTGTAGDRSTPLVLTISPPGSRVYTTNFPLNENPISESGNWIDGNTVGRDWANIATTPGLSFGTESGSTFYDDSVAVLTGAWGPNQTGQATVHSMNQTGGNIQKEVELLLHFSLSAHTAQGYEVALSANNANPYLLIVRWNGALGGFTILQELHGAQFIITTGDVFKATIVGNVITAYLNDVQLGQVTDNTYANGNPGIGFYLNLGTGVNNDYGFTSFAASD